MHISARLLTALGRVPDKRRDQKVLIQAEAAPSGTFNERVQPPSRRCSQSERVKLVLNYGEVRLMAWSFHVDPLFDLS
jgi:hypothetical protein